MAESALSRLPGERIKNDAYYTDPVLVTQIVARVERWRVRLNCPTPVDILEPSSGHGAFVEAVRKTYPHARITAVDIDPAARSYALAKGADKFVCADFAKTKCSSGFDLIIGNPPFLFAIEHYLHAQTLLRPGKWLSFLFRGAIANGVDRADRVWTGEHRCINTPIIPRPSFTQDGRTDRYDYSNFVWIKGSTRWGIFDVPLRWRR